MTKRHGAIAVALMVASLGLWSTPAHANPATGGAAPGLLGGVTVKISDGEVSLFTTYPDMAFCEALLLTNCYLFSDGTVVGQTDPFAVLTLLLGVVDVPVGACTAIPSLGSSPDIVQVYAGTGVPLLLGAGSCADLSPQVVGHDEYLIVPFATETIPPTAASVEDLPVAIAPRLPLGLGGG